MATLLAALLPTLDDRDWTDCLNELAELGVTDAGALLFPPHPLVGDALAAQQLVQHYFSVDGQTAQELRNRETAYEGHSSSTGVAGLDELIQGWRPGELIEISGSKGSGKSLLALTSILHCLYDHDDAAALLIDTEGHFTAQRAYEMTARIAAARGYCSSTPPGSRDPIIEQRLQRLHITRRTDVGGVIGAISDTVKSTRMQNQVLRFVLIDTVTRLFQDKLNTPSGRGHASMAALVQRLRRFADDDEQPLCVMIVNSSVSALPLAPLASFTETKRKPALGPTFSHLVDSTLWLSNASDLVTPVSAKTCVAEIWRSRREPSGTICAFRHDGVAMLP